MALPKIEAVRAFSDQELADEIVATKRQLFELRFQKATRQLEKEVHQFKHARHRLAQLMTVQRERQIQKPPANLGSVKAAPESAEKTEE